MSLNTGVHVCIDLGSNPQLNYIVGTDGTVELTIEGRDDVDMFTTERGLETFLARGQDALAAVRQRMTETEG